MSQVQAQTRVVCTHALIARWFRCHDCPKFGSRPRLADIQPQDIGTCEGIVGEDVIVTLDKYPECPVILPRAIVRAADATEGGHE